MRFVEIERWGGTRLVRESTDNRRGHNRKPAAEPQRIFLLGLSSRLCPNNLWLRLHCETNSTMGGLLITNPATANCHGPTSNYRLE